MNTYDFDETIFNPDSSYAFIMYCWKKFPGKMLKTLPGVVSAAFVYSRDKSRAKDLKEKLFAFLPEVDDIDALVEEFWACHISGIGDWYLKQKKDDDIIISASPEFLLEPIANHLGVRLIATPMDKRSGKINGKNCHDHEKVRRFYENHPGAHTEEFYSDSLSDSPMAMIADKAFMVNKGKLSPWPNK